MYVYINSEPGLWTVGFYSPDGEWHAESDWNSTKEAAERVHYLNGGRNDEDGPDEAEAMFNEHQRMKEAMGYREVRKHVDYGDI